MSDGCGAGDGDKCYWSVVYVVWRTPVGPNNMRKSPGSDGMTVAAVVVVVANERPDSSYGALPWRCRRRFAYICWVQMTDG